MKYNQQSVKKYNLGFTLIELLVVISIIGILSGVVLTSLRNSKTKAINSNIQSSLAQLAKVAADVDNLVQGGDGNGNCDILFANPEMRKLVNFAADQAGREVVYTYCSKSASDYLFTFISPKVGSEGEYFCVDQTMGVKQVYYENISSILNDYSCSAIDTNTEEHGTPLTIVSAVYDAGGNITITFNQNVFNGSLGGVGVPSVTISDTKGNVFDNNGAGYLLNLDGASVKSFAVSSPILCVAAVTPWGTYSQETHYLSISNVYGAESHQVGNMSVTITCPVPTLYCTGSLNAENYGTCTPASCTGYRSCSFLNEVQCYTESGCIWDAESNICTGNLNNNVCSSFAPTGDTCPVGCTFTPESVSCQYVNKSCSDYSSTSCPTAVGCTISTTL